VEASEPVEPLTRDHQINIMQYITQLSLTFAARFLVVRTVVSVFGAGVDDSPSASCKRSSEKKSLLERRNPFVQQF
jgi:hypothetical protein